MNYRHIYHAGNRCDVVKHSVLSLILGHLRAKDKGFAVLDTHAGIGLYDLNDPRALKTSEALDGICRLIEKPELPMLADYYSVLHKVNPLWSQGSPDHFRVYPGSPLVIFHMLREQDRLIACELHPDDAEILRLVSPASSHLQIHKRDGYEAMGAFLPPPEKRGLVLIDPPYENPDEFGYILKKIRDVYHRWTTGIFMIWYPIKDRPDIWAFHEALATSGIGKILCAEFIYEEEIRTDRLQGSGLILINPPWKLDEQLKVLFTALHHMLETAYAGSTVGWLSP